MKLGTLADGSRDGRLVVVNRQLSHAVLAHEAATMQAALDNWDALAPSLAATASDLEDGRIAGFALDFAELAAPLPRAFSFIDSSVYLSHMERARALRGTTLPDTYRREPLISLRISAPFTAAHASIEIPNDGVDIDIEAEIAVIIGDVPAGASKKAAADSIRLVTLVNDVSLRAVIAAETAEGRSVYRGKTSAAMAVVAVTPDELGPAWAASALALPLHVAIRGIAFGRPDAGRDAAFDFADIISYAATYRPLVAGTVVASGTVSNVDPAAGTACIAERRMIETKENGAPRTPYLRPGDSFSIDCRDVDGLSIFGAITQMVV